MRFEHRERFATIGGINHSVATLLEQFGGEGAINEVILDKKDGSRILSFAQGVTGHQWGGSLSWIPLEDVTNGVEEFALPDRLDKISRNIELTAARSFADLPGGSEHNKRDVSIGRILANFRGKGKTVHARHVAIKKHERKSDSTGGGKFEGLQGSGTAVNGGGAHDPRREHAKQDAALGGNCRRR